MAGNIDTFVVDASFILASLLPDEKSPESDEVVRRYLKREIQIVSSPIFNLEILNSLKAAKLSKRISSQGCLDFARQFLKLKIICEDIDVFQTFLLALETDLTLYDASYVWLARSKNVPLLSLDRRMVKLAAK